MYSIYDWVFQRFLYQFSSTTGLSRILISGCSRMSLGVTLLLLPFNRTIVFGFPLSHWPIQSHILGNQSIVIVRQGFHFMGWALNVIIKWFVTPQHFCHYFTSLSCRQITMVDQRFCIWAYGYFSPLVVGTVYSSTINTSQQGCRL